MQTEDAHFAMGSGDVGSGDFGSGEDLDAFLPDDEGRMRRLTDGTVEDPAENEYNAMMSDLISAENASVCTKLACCACACCEPSMSL